MHLQLHDRKLNHQAIASALGISRSAVTNSLRLLLLPQTIKNMLQNKEIDMGHARALLGLTEEHQLSLALKIVKNNLSVRQAEEMVKQMNNPQTQKSGAAKPSAKEIDPNIGSLLQRCSDVLSTKVELIHKPNGKGELRIAYGSTNHLNELLTKLAPEALELDE